MGFQNEKGITLITLTVTIIVMLILATVGIGSAMNSGQSAADSTLRSELGMVQNAVLQRNTKVDLTGDTDNLPGSRSTPTEEEFEAMKNKIGNDFIGVSASEYKKLTPDELSKLGITNVKDTYIVNYSTGEVYNFTKKETSNGQVLYAYSNNKREYAKEGLILHYDGINNTGEGDDKHSNTATTWKDLSENGNNGILTNFNGNDESGWQNKCLKFDGVDDVAYREMNIDTNNCTIEVTATYYSGAYIFRSNAGIRTYMKDVNVVKGLPDATSIDFQNYKNERKATRVLMYYKEKDQKYLNAYYNANKSEEKTFEDNEQNGTYISIASFRTVPDQLSKIDVYSVRIYNRALTDQEIANNYQVDKARFNIEE